MSIELMLLERQSRVVIGFELSCVGIFSVGDKCQSLPMLAIARNIYFLFYTGAM
jgi:hypothetical protein